MGDIHGVFRENELSFIGKRLRTVFGLKGAVLVWGGGVAFAGCPCGHGVPLQFLGLTKMIPTSPGQQSNLPTP